MMIQVIKPMMGFPVGRIVELAGGVADIWIRRGHAVKHDLVCNRRGPASDKMLRTKPKRTRKRKPTVETK